MGDQSPRGSGTLTALAVAGFALAGATGRSARASLTQAVATTAVGSTVLTTGFVVAIIIVAVRDKRKKQQDRETQSVRTGRGSWVTPKHAPTSLTQDLLWSGLLSHRGELGLQFGLLAGSPGTIDQLTDEFARGGGPALHALTTATGIAPAELQPQWEATLQAHGAVKSQEDAIAVLAAFLAQVAPDLTLNTQVEIDYLWALNLETAYGAGPTLMWTAHWLGVSPAAVRQAATDTFSRLPRQSEEARRAHIRENADALLAQLTTAIEADNRDAVQERVVHLMREMGHWLPPHLRPETAAE